jgi:hypothetical protein
MYNDGKEGCKMKNVNVTLRVDEDLKKQAEALFSELDPDVPYKEDPVRYAWWLHLKLKLHIHHIYKPWRVKLLYLGGVKAPPFFCISAYIARVKHIRQSTVMWKYHI